MPNFKKLTNLKTLILWHATSVNSKNIPVSLNRLCLACINTATILDLSRLTNLTELDIYKSSVKNILINIINLKLAEHEYCVYSLSKLTNLKNLEYTKYNSRVNLHNLKITELYLRSCESVLPETLTKLKITHIPDNILNLKNLTCLDLRKTNYDILLPKKILLQLTYLKCYAEHLKNIDPEYILSAPLKLQRLKCYRLECCKNHGYEVFDVTRGFKKILINMIRCFN